MLMLVCIYLYTAYLVSIDGTKPTYASEGILLKILTRLLLKIHSDGYVNKVGCLRRAEIITINVRFT